jgi:hypothetical protein
MNRASEEMPVSSLVRRIVRRALKMLFAPSFRRLHLISVGVTGRSKIVYRAIDTPGFRFLVLVPVYGRRLERVSALLMFLRSQN